MCGGSGATLCYVFAIASGVVDVTTYFFQPNQHKVLHTWYQKSNISIKYRRVLFLRDRALSFYLEIPFQFYNT